MGEIHYTMVETVLGTVIVAVSARGLCAVLPGDDPVAIIEELRKRFPRDRLVRDDDATGALAADVAAAVDGRTPWPAPLSQLPLDLRGTPFQQSVWQELRRIPAGTTVSYGDLAARVGRPRAVRAVAQACGANPLAVIVPCHRVVGRDGSLTGYRWGIDRKKTLLAHESGRPRTNSTPAFVLRLTS